MIGLFAVFGEPITPPVIGFVDPAGVGAKHGLQENDRILEINHEKIHSFENMLPFIRSGKHEVLSIKLERAKKQVQLNIPLTLKDKETGEIQKIKVLGIKPNPSKEYKEVSFGAAVQTAFSTFWGMCKTIVVGLGELLTGQRRGDELGGILAIGDMASQSAKLGVAGMLWFMIIMSINLGLINLFPIPVLDGGQMLMTSIEWVIGKPLPEKVQKYIFGSGFALVISLMLYSTWNDIVRFNVIQKICTLFQIVRGWSPL
jgi:regulator of sigma E protease